MTDAQKIADRFADILKAWLTRAQYTEMRRRNATRLYRHNICASHDFCDANIAMAEAFEEALYRPADIGGDSKQSQADIGLWCRAWEIAKRKRLTARRH
jgi:hypothetical protein